MRSMTNLIICSALLLSACTQPPRPQTLVWGVNGSASRLEGYNMHDDYGADGVLIAGAQKKIKPLPNGILDLNGAVCFLPTKPDDALGDQGIKGVKIWISDSRAWAKDHCE